jgi:hypothetical protein
MFWFSRRRPIASAAIRRQRAARLQVEALESRLAPATLVDAHTVTYQDVDGDRVTVALSRPILNTGNVNQVFLFNTGLVNGDNSGTQQLQSIKLAGLATAAGVSLQVTAVRGGGNAGDGFVDVGAIDATGLDLASVFVGGDLGNILAGDTNTVTPGLASLRVQSMGLRGLTTQPAGGTLESTIIGSLSSLRVGSNLDQVGIEVKVTGTDLGHASIGSLVVVGSVGGFVFATGNIRTVSVGGSMTGGVQSLGSLGSVSIGGSVIGGVVKADHDIGKVVVGGSVTGGAIEFTGEIAAGGNAGAITIRGDLDGGSGLSSGRVSCGTIATIVVGGSLVGGTGGTSGVIAANAMNSVSVGGDLIGGAGARSGWIGDSAGAATLKMGMVRIGRDVRGGSGPITGVIDAALLKNVSVGGNLVGGTGDSSGQIGGEVVGAVSIHGSVLGGSASDAGVITAETLGRVVIGGDLRGGDDPINASIRSSGNIEANTMTSVSIGGSIIAGRNNNVDPIAHSLGQSGAITLILGIGSLTVGGSLVGNATNHVVISAQGQAKPTAPNDVAIARLTVLGSVEFTDILAGYTPSVTPSGIRYVPAGADAQIGRVFVGVDWIASTLLVGAIVSGNSFTRIVDPKDNPAILSSIAAVTIGGRVQADPGTVTPPPSGFAAEFIKSLTVGGVALLLSAGAHNDHLFVVPNVRLLEV